MSKKIISWLGVTAIIFCIFFFTWYKFGMVYDFGDWSRYEASRYLDALVWWTLFVPLFLAITIKNITIDLQKLMRQKNRVAIFRKNVRQGIRDAIIFVIIIGVMGMIRVPVITMTTNQFNIFLLLWSLQLVTAFLSLTTMHILMMVIYNGTNKRWLALIVATLISIVVMATTSLTVPLPWQYYAIVSMIGEWPDVTIVIPYFMMGIWIFVIIGIYLIGESKAKWLQWYK